MQGIPLSISLFLWLASIAATMVLSASLAFRLGKRSLKSTEGQLQEGKHHDLLESLDVIVWEYDPATRQMTYVSPPAVRMLGYSIEEWKVTDFWPEHIHPDDREKTVRYCMEATCQLLDHTFEYRMMAKDGRIVWIRDIVSVHGKKGKPVKLRGLMIDCTEQHAAQRALRESLERFNLMASGSQGGLWDISLLYGNVFDPKKPIYYSKKFKELLGFSEVDFPNVVGSSLDLIFPDDWERVEQAVNDHLENRVPFEVEFRMYTASGAVRWFSSQGQATWDEQGKPVRFSGGLFDITERRKAADMIRVSEQRLRLMVENLPVGAVHVNGNTLTLNRAAEIITGYSRSEIRTLDDWFTLMFGNLCPLMRSHYESDRRAAFLSPRILSITRKDGHTRYVEFAGYRGDPDEIWILQDVTERYISDERFRALFERASDAHLLLDLQQGIVDCNQATVNMLGYTSKEEILGRFPQDISPIYQADGSLSNTRATEMVMLACRHGTNRFDWLHQRANGESIHCEVTLTSVRMGEGVMLLAVWHDLTERKRTEDQLRLIRSQLIDAIESLDSGFVMYDSQERLVICNQRYRDEYARADGLVVGRRYEDILRSHWEQHGPFDDRDVDAWITEELEKFREMQGIREERVAERWLRVSTARTPNGCIVSLRTDITPLKEVERDIRLAKDAAEAANVSKSEFLANMSHEIRTPMTAILGFADCLLLEPGLEHAPPERREAIHTIQKNGEHLLQIINDILDLSKIEAGKMKLESLNCSPREIVSEAISLMRVHADAKGLDLKLSLSDSLPEAIHSDSTRLRQILLNLLGNAIKFTQSGSVSLSVRANRSADGARPNHVVLEFEIADTGIGMTADEIGRLFQPFSQADTSTTRRFGGTGLGLTICRRLAVMLGGEIDVRSEFGNGSVFTVYITAPVVAAVTAATDKRTTLEAIPAGQSDQFPEPYRILIAEDGLDNQRLIQFLLRKSGGEPTVVENGQLALDLALQMKASGTPFDVILMDMQMPVLDGYQATSRLRAGGYRNPIIALTAHAMSSDQEKCLAAGCDDFATKPINRRKLVDQICNAIRVHAHRESS